MAAPCLSTFFVTTNQFWMPDQVRQDGLRPFYETVKVQKFNGSEVQLIFKLFKP
jgi:hypothetical protein